VFSQDLTRRLLIGRDQRVPSLREAVALFVSIDSVPLEFEFPEETRAIPDRFPEAFRATRGTPARGRSPPISGDRIGGPADAAAALVHPQTKSHHLHLRQTLLDVGGAAPVRA
jgi:hypothetical protein